MISAFAIAARVSEGDIVGAMALMSGWAVTFAVLTAISFVGWRVTRYRQMRRQYPFLYPAVGR